MHLISVIIPCYNGEKFIDNCFDHLLNQTYKNLEIIITDDGSTDNSLKLLKGYKKKFKDKNIKYKVLEQDNAGAASAINNCLKYVTGDFLVWQDIDDYYEYNAIEIMHNFIIETNSNIIRGEARMHNKGKIQLRKSKYPLETDIFDMYIFEKDTYSYAGIFMVKMGFFDERIKERKIYESKGGQNWQIILPLTYNSKCFYLNKIVYNINVVENSHSRCDKTLNDLLTRANIHQDMLINSIYSIDMNKRKMKRYVKKIKWKYSKVKVRILLSKIKKQINKWLDALIWKK